MHSGGPPTRTRIIIKVRALLPVNVIPNFMLYSMFDNQRLKGKLSKKCKKHGINIWSICCKAVILHPLSREKRGSHEILNKDEDLNLTDLKKTFLKKLQKVLVVQK